MSESSPSDGSVPARLVTTEEREAAVKRLTSAFADDAIEVAEFERRVAEVYKAADVKALDALTRDLPAAPAAGAKVPAVSDTAGALAPRPRRRRIASVLSSVERRVGGPMPEVLHVRAVMGNVELDLRDADFAPGVTEIRIRSIMGNVEIELPRHVRVENDGRAFLGHVAVETRGRGRGGREADAQAPVVRVTGRSLMASVEVEIDD